MDEYQKLCEYSESLEENWGKPPGQLNSNGQELLVFGKQYGNVFIGVQVRARVGAGGVRVWRGVKCCALCRWGDYLLPVCSRQGNTQTKSYVSLWISSSTSSFVCAHSS